MGAARTASPLARLAAALEDGTSLLEQAAAVLRAHPDPAELAFHGVGDPAELPLGVADRRLLATYEQATGGHLEVTAVCAACGDRTTLSLGVASVGPHVWASVHTGEGSGVREPSYADLLAAAGAPAEVLDRCRVGATGRGGPRGGWADLDRAEQSLAGPLRSSCAECGDPISVDADVVALVLRGLAVLSADLDREVHLLASTYGWDLATIEALPDHRRQRLAALVDGVTG